MRCPLLSFLRAPALGSDIPLTGPTAAVWIAPEEVVAASQGHAEDVTVLTTRAGTYAVLGELQEVVAELNDALQEGERERRRQLDSLLLGVEAYMAEINPGSPALSRFVEALTAPGPYTPPRRRAFHESYGEDTHDILEPAEGCEMRQAVGEAAVRSWINGGAPVEFRHREGGRFLVAVVRVPDDPTARDGTMRRTRMALAFLEELRERGELATEGHEEVPEWMAEKLRREEKAETGATVAPLFREELREEAMAERQGYDSPARRVARAVWESSVSVGGSPGQHIVSVHCPTAEAAGELRAALHKLAEAGAARDFDPTAAADVVATLPALAWDQARDDARRLCGHLGSLPISSAAELSPDGAEALRIVEAALDDAKLLRDYLERTGPRNFVEVAGGPVELGENARLLTEDPEDFALRWALVVRLLTRAYELSHHLPEAARAMTSPGLFVQGGDRMAKASLQGWLAWLRDCYADQLAEVAGGEA